jgi:rfaE bifunctional protein kinase chain/domain
MNDRRLSEVTGKYAAMRLALVGDFCLDRYLEIDPARAEVSIETGLPVHNVVAVRAQPGAAGTILNNLLALGIGTVHTVGFCGEDGEGFELKRALQARGPAVNTGAFLQTPLRRTFTYCKPLLVKPGEPPVELNRLDTKNWSPTPAALEAELARALESLAPAVDAVILMDQVDAPDTGVVTRALLQTVRAITERHPALPIVADSRRGLSSFPPVTFKMNAKELSVLCGNSGPLDPTQAMAHAAKLARANQRPVFVTLAEQGIAGADADGHAEHVPALPLRGPIDIVGAGDAVTANLTAALVAGATLREALEIATAAASIVIHQLGTTGTASVPQIHALLAAGAWS